jgi:hypothetical protein
MIRALILLIVLPLFLWSASFDPVLLQIGGKVFPKVMLMEQGTKERITDSLNILIVANEPYRGDAVRLSEIIRRQYGKNFNVNVSINTSKEAQKTTNLHGMILLLEGKESGLPPLIDQAHKSKTLTFCLDPDLLGKGVAVSLHIGKTVKPYLNLTVLRKVPFTFEYGFLKLSQPYPSYE